MAKKRRDDLLLWIDTETTGLDPLKHRILEIACMVTDRDLKIVAPLRSHLLQYDVSDWDLPDAVWDMHSESGLLDEVHRPGMDGLSEYKGRIDVQDALCLWLSGIAEPGTLTPAGNSVNFDVGFLRVHMPRVYELLHYRQLNVSSIAMWCLWQYGEELPKVKGHRAAADLMESYGELCWLRDHLQWSFD